MKSTLFLGTLALVLSGSASAQTSTLPGQTNRDGGQAEAQVVTISGDVVRYEPGRVIVIRGQDGKEATYTLSPGMLPADVQVGQTVTLHTERGASGSPTTVSRIVTTSVTSEGKVKVSTDETRTTAEGKTTKTHTTAISGEVVKYEPGKVIVVRGPGRKVVTYTLAPGVSAPADIQVGKNVTLYTEPGAGGRKTTVTRMTTTSVTPEGDTKTTTQETRTDPFGLKTVTTTTDVAGTVEAYTAGKTITLLRSDGSRVTYAINPLSTVPGDVMIGKSITIVPVNPQEAVVQTITIRQP